MDHTEIIWKECSTSLKAFIRRRVPDEEVAEDILQDVFLKIQSQIGTLEDVRKSRYWLFRIARNTIIDYYRTRKTTVELPDNLMSPTFAACPEVIEELAPCIRSMVERLPEKYREAVMLTAYQGLTQKEMSEELGISLTGAKSRVQRAREKLKTMLLDCCRFELDRRGKVIDYERNCCAE
ncbi:MAG: RNA polymerase sigma factor SigZ [Pseudomonadota bacterium]